MRAKCTDAIGEPAAWDVNLGRRLCARSLSWARLSGATGGGVGQHPAGFENHCGL